MTQHKDMSHYAEEVLDWQITAYADMDDVRTWCNNLRGYARYGTATKAQRKAALKRIENLRASLDGLEVAINKPFEKEHYPS